MVLIKMSRNRAYVRLVIQNLAIEALSNISPYKRIKHLSSYDIHNYIANNKDNKKIQSPFTTVVRALISLEKDGKIKSEVINKKSYWSLIDEV